MCEGMSKDSVISHTFNALTMWTVAAYSLRVCQAYGEIDHLSTGNRVQTDQGPEQHKVVSIETSLGNQAGVKAVGHRTMH